jgi:large subunit ribosomal protein L25
VLSELRSEVEIEALPSDVPNQLDVDLSSLRNVGDAIHVSDITAPSGVTILTSSDELLAHVVPLAVEAEPQVAEEAEAEAEAAAAEGAPAEGETSEE